MRSTRASDVAEQWYIGGYRFGPNVDRWVLPRPVLDAFATPAGHAHVPVLIGTGSDEGTTLAGPGLSGGPVVTAADYERAVRLQFADQATRVLAQYPVRAFDSPFYAFSPLSPARP